MPRGISSPAPAEVSLAERTGGRGGAFGWGTAYHGVPLERAASDGRAEAVPAAAPGASLGAVSVRTVSAVPSSSSIVKPSASASRRKVSTSGSECPCSHLLTACLVTWSFFANSACVRLAFARFARRKAPISCIPCVFCINIFLSAMVRQIGELWIVEPGKSPISWAHYIVICGNFQGGRPRQILKKPPRNHEVTPKS